MIKRLFLNLFLCMTLCAPGFAALSATTIWDVRTTGNAANGGGYNATAGSTDYSQQDAAQWSGTDLACADHITPFNVTSASSTFTDVIEGNLIYISDTGAAAHFGVGWYEVTGYVDANTIQLDRDPTDGTDETGGDFKIGGAVAHPQTIAASVVAGNTIYIKNGTYVKQGANTYVLSASVLGGSGTPVIWEGYASTHGDAPTTTSRPMFDGDSDSDEVDDTNTGIACSVAGNIFRYFRITNTTSSGFGGAGASVYTWVQSNTNSGDGASFSSGACWFCELGSNTGDGFDTSSSGSALFYYSYAHDNGGFGFRKNNTGGTMGSFYSIADSNVSTGFTCNGEMDPFVGNISYNNSGASSDGFYWSEAAADLRAVFFQNIAVSNGQYGFNRSSATVRFPAIFNYNAYYGNGTAGLNNITAGSHDVTSDPLFTSASGGDFTLTSSSPLLGTGPQTWPGATGDYQWNIGIDQDDNAVATCNDVFGMVT